MSFPLASGLGNPTSKILPWSKKYISNIYQTITSPGSRKRCHSWKYWQWWYGFWAQVLLNSDKTTAPFMKMGMKCVFSKSGKSLKTLKLETGSPEFSLRLFLTTRIFHTKLLQFKFVAQLDYHIFHHPVNPVKRDWRSNIHDNVWIDWFSYLVLVLPPLLGLSNGRPFSSLSHKLLCTGGKTHIFCCP